MCSLESVPSFRAGYVTTFVCAILMMLSDTKVAFAAWERYVGTPIADWTDEPSPHALSFFVGNSCIARSPTGRLSKCGKTRTKLHLIGRISNVTVYDLNYYADNSYEPPDAVDAKSILVQSAPGVFHEIYHRARTQIDAALPAIRLVLVGSDWILEATYGVSGMHRSEETHFFSVGEQGTKLLDTGPLIRAAYKVLPEDSVIWMPTSGLSFRARTWGAGTEPKILTGGGPKISCCNGRVTVGFKLENGDFVVTSATYVRDDRD